MTCDADEMKPNGGCLAELEGKGGGKWGSGWWTEVDRAEYRGGFEQIFSWVCWRGVKSCYVRCFLDVGFRGCGRNETEIVCDLESETTAVAGGQQH